MIEFRWIAVIALWTLAIGPIFDLTPASSKGPASRASATAPRSAVGR